ncbi:poly A polymerase C-terminal region-like protein [Meredithblackwellia eburnea MCA 4105]
MTTASAVSPTISLNHNEQKLATLLVQCADWVEQNPQEVDALRLKDDRGQWIGRERGDEPVELRIAGGWVRDKLLQRDSDDIDVSTSPDPITGLKFATLFEKYLSSIGQSDLMGKLTKIEAKPDQSKHLETATANVCGLSVDWVQQRGNEVYREDSRIPTVTFGTPLEDAQRRDLTINALFFNLRTKEIEDQTGNGLRDLGLVPGVTPRIRTPLEPYETFHDDPLRVMRAVRFAARFGRAFELDPELEAAIGRDEIRASLRDPNKISRERVGHELDKMLLGADPLYAMELIERLRLHQLIFLSTTDSFTADDPSTAAPAPDTSLTIRTSTILADVFALPSQSPPQFRPILHPLLTFPSVSPVVIRRLFFSAGLLPIYDQLALEKGKQTWLGGHVIMEGIKGTASDRKWCENARKASEILAEGVRNFGGSHASGDIRERVEIGMLLRDLAVEDPIHGAEWRISLLWSLVVELARSSNDLTKQTELIDSYSRFIERILSHGLEEAAFKASVLDGTEILATMPAAKGPAMTGMKENVVRWQLAHPTGTKAECVEWLKGEEAAVLLQESSRQAAEVMRRAREARESGKKKKVKSS